MDEEYLTPSQVAKRLRVDVTTVTRWIRNGALEAETVRQGRLTRYRIRKATIEKIEAPNNSHPFCKINSIATT
jgi:excisionase family DNA binding protein